MCVAFVALAAAAQAQTNDHLYRSWRWSPNVGSARAAGLGGAFAAVADGSEAAWLNPAGLSTLTKSEIGIGLTRSSSEKSNHRDPLQSGSRFGHLSGGGRIGASWAVGGYLYQPVASTVRLSPADGGEDGILEAEVIDGGGAVAHRLGSGLNVGVRVTATHLKLSGQYRRTGPDGLELEVGTAAGHTRVTASAGALYDAGQLRIAVVGHTGASYLASRTANGPAGALDVGSEYEVRNPSSVTAGAALRLGRKLLVAGQLDYVRYSEMRAFLRPGTGSESAYEVEDAMEPRLGFEISQPIGNVSVQFRGGVHSEGPGSLRFTGADPAERAAFAGGRRRTHVSGGVSILSITGVGLDAAVVAGDGRTELLIGARMRF